MVNVLPLKGVWFIVFGTLYGVILPSCGFDYKQIPFPLRPEVFIQISGGGYYQFLVTVFHFCTE